MITKLETLQIKLNTNAKKSHLSTINQIIALHLEEWDNGRKPGTAIYRASKIVARDLSRFQVSLWRSLYDKPEKKQEWVNLFSKAIASDESSKVVWLPKKQQRLIDVRIQVYKILIEIVKSQD